MAVIASLIFVGVQLRTATRAVRASTSQAHSALYHAIVVTIVDNGEFANIWRRALVDFDSCSLDERVRFVAQASALFRYYESSRVQWLRGQLDPEHWFDGLEPAPRGLLYGTDHSAQAEVESSV